MYFDRNVMSSVPKDIVQSELAVFDSEIKMSTFEASKIVAENSALKIQNQKLIIMLQNLSKRESDIYIYLTGCGWDRNNKPDPLDFIKQKLHS